MEDSPNQIPPKDLIAIDFNRIKLESSCNNDTKVLLYVWNKTLSEVGSSKFERLSHKMMMTITSTACLLSKA